jgi:hypothetical protein
MEDWELEWRKNRAEETALRADQRAADQEKRAAFPEKQNVIIGKLENFVLKWNADDAQGAVSKKITIQRIRPELCRVATVTTRTIRMPDGTTSDSHLNLDVEFDNLNAVVKSSLHFPWSNDSIGEEAVLSLVVAPNGDRYFFSADGKRVDNGHIIGEILRPLLKYLE